MDRQINRPTLQPLVGPSAGSLCHPPFTATNLSYKFSIFETCATALCGTIGIDKMDHMENKYKMDNMVQMGNIEQIEIIER